MRFVVTDDQGIALPAIADTLKGVGPSCELAADSEATRPSADLVFGGNPCAELEINTPGDGLFDEELGELKEFLEDFTSQTRSTTGRGNHSVGHR